MFALYLPSEQQCVLLADAFILDLELEHLWIACWCLAIGTLKLCKMVEQSVGTVYRICNGDDEASDEWVGHVIWKVMRGEDDPSGYGICDPKPDG